MNKWIDPYLEDNVKFVYNNKELIGIVKGIFFTEITTTYTVESDGTKYQILKNKLERI